MDMQAAPSDSGSTPIVSVIFASAGHAFIPRTEADALDLPYDEMTDDEIKRAENAGLLPPAPGLSS